MKAVLIFILSVVAMALPMHHQMVNSTNISLRHKIDPVNELLLVTVTRKQVITVKGERVAQAATSLLYRFDLGPSRKVVETIPGLPLKLYPVNQSKMSTYATFLPEAAEGYFRSDSELTHVHQDGDVDDDDDDDDEQQKEPLHWQGSQDDFDAKVHLELATSGTKRYAKIRTWLIQGDEREELDAVEADIPVVFNSGQDHPHIMLNRCHGAASSLKQIILHYYRGSSHKAYGKMQEVLEYVHTAVIGFLSPFVLLGLVLLLIVVGVFVFCDLVCYRAQSRIALPTLDEESLLGSEKA